MKDLGKLSSFLGIKFEQKGHCVVMSQKHYLESILKSNNMENCKPRKTQSQRMQTGLGGPAAIPNSKFSFVVNPQSLISGRV